MSSVLKMKFEEIKKELEGIKNNNKSILNNSKKNNEQIDGMENKNIYFRINIGKVKNLSKQSIQYCVNKTNNKFFKEVFFEIKEIYYSKGDKNKKEDDRLIIEIFKNQLFKFKESKNKEYIYNLLYFMYDLLVNDKSVFFIDDELKKMNKYNFLLINGGSWVFYKIIKNNSIGRLLKKSYFNEQGRKIIDLYIEIGILDSVTYNGEEYLYVNGYYILKLVLEYLDNKEKIPLKSFLENIILFKNINKNYYSTLRLLIYSMLKNTDQKNGKVFFSLQEILFNKKFSLNLDMKDLNEENNNIFITKQGIKYNKMINGIMKRVGCFSDGFIDDRSYIFLSKFIKIDEKFKGKELFSLLNNKEIVKKLEKKYNNISQFNVIFNNNLELFKEFSLQDKEIFIYKLIELEKDLFNINFFKLEIFLDEEIHYLIFEKFQDLIILGQINGQLKKIENIKYLKKVYKYIKSYFNSEEKNIKKIFKFIKGGKDFVKFFNMYNYGSLKYKNIDLGFSALMIEYINYIKKDKNIIQDIDYKKIFNIFNNVSCDKKIMFSYLKMLLIYNNFLPNNEFIEYLLTIIDDLDLYTYVLIYIYQFFEKKDILNISKGIELVYKKFIDINIDYKDDLSNILEYGQLNKILEEVQSLNYLEKKKYLKKIILNIIIKVPELLNVIEIKDKHKIEMFIKLKNYKNILPLINNNLNNDEKLNDLFSIIDFKFKNQDIYFDNNIISIIFEIYKNNKYLKIRDKGSIFFNNINIEDEKMLTKFIKIMFNNDCFKGYFNQLKINYIEDYWLKYQNKNKRILFYFLNNSKYTIDFFINSELYHYFIDKIDITSTDILNLYNDSFNNSGKEEFIKLVKCIIEGKKIKLCDKGLLGIIKLIDIFFLNKNDKKYYIDLIIKNNYKKIVKYYNNSKEKKEKLIKEIIEWFISDKNTYYSNIISLYDILKIEQIKFIKIKYIDILKKVLELENGLNKKYIISDIYSILSLPLNNINYEIEEISKEYGINKEYKVYTKININLKNQFNSFKNTYEDIKDKFFYKKTGFFKGIFQNKNKLIKENEQEFKSYLQKKIKDIKSEINFVDSEIKKIDKVIKHFKKITKNLEKNIEYLELLEKEIDSMNISNKELVKILNNFKLNSLMKTNEFIRVTKERMSLNLKNLIDLKLVFSDKYKTILNMFGNNIDLIKLQNSMEILSKIINNK